MQLFDDANYFVMSCWRCPNSMSSRVYVTVRHPSVSPIIDSSTGMQQVCCWESFWQEISISSSGQPAAPGPQYSIQQQIQAVPCWQRSWRGCTQTCLSCIATGWVCDLQWYRNHFDRLDDIMTQLDSSMHHEHDIQHAVSDFEAQKLCYLPLTAFYLKPYQRLLHYQLLLESMTSHCQCIVFAVYDSLCSAFIFLGYLFLQAMKYKKKVKVAHTRLPSVRFRRWSRFLAVSLQVMQVIKFAVGCHPRNP